MLLLVFGGAPAVAQQSARPLEPIGVVVDALHKAPIVALGEVHGNEQCEQFRLALLRDARVTDLVNDIVVEFGNAKYQNVMDSFVAGADVAHDLGRLHLLQALQLLAQTSLPLGGHGDLLFGHGGVF